MAVISERSPADLWGSDRTENRIVQPQSLFIASVPCSSLENIRKEAREWPSPTHSHPSHQVF